jgi:hypothetical protein
MQGENVSSLQLQKIKFWKENFVRERMQNFDRAAYGVASIYSYCRQRNNKQQRKGFDSQIRLHGGTGIL